MLKTLRIRDLAIIEDLTVEFGPGLNLLTGETGAGKSIVVDALSLVVGERADSSLVRTGAARAVVEAVFEVPESSALPAWFEGHGIDVPEREIAIRREIAPAGAGRAFVNGSPCTLSVIREAGGRLVELHGQHEHQSLLSPERHQELLDRFGGHAEALDAVRDTHRRLLDARAELETHRSSGADRERRAERLREVLREIDAVAPRPGERDALLRERQILRHSGRLAALLEEAVGALHDGEPTAASLAACAARRVAEMAGVDGTLEALARRIEEARLELEDAGEVLRDYRERTDFDPARLDAVESRLASLDRLCLRHGEGEEAVLAAREEAARELASLDAIDSRIAQAEAAVRAAERDYVAAARLLSTARRRAAKRLGPQVASQLESLALARARFEASLAPARGPVVDGDGQPPVPLHPHGAERIEFLLAANPGEEARPLAKVASGGELSRVMLALHAVLEGAGEERVLVFDEVDAGIGGPVAHAVGARLAALARDNQVLCVTHLPQVAAHGERHYHVRKRVVGGRTRAEVEPLSEEGRVDELARMLGGSRVTAASRRNAEDLLAGAGRPRPAARERKA